jgi:hypothetical protein
MTPKTLITIVLAGAALTLGTQAAVAGPSPAAMREDSFDKAVATSTALAMREDGFDRAVAAKLALQSSPQSMFRRVFDPDLYRTAAVSASVPVSATDSGTQIEWLQIGIGFGVGILLALGLGLAVRVTRVRPLTH